MTTRARRRLLACAAALVLGGTGSASAAGTAPVAVPADGSAYYGVNLDWGTDSPAAYVLRTGLRPAVYGKFVGLPLSDAEQEHLRGAVDALAPTGAAVMLTVEPLQGLDSVTPAVAEQLADQLAAVNAQGVDVLLRFGHEMNGSWYAWGQQPTDYVSAFRRVAAAVHTRAPRTAVLWAPNYGGGYPYRGGRYAAQPGTPDFAALDTDGDGALTMADDPYAPYYPGDDAVDWVGLTAYHFGNAWPWGENEVPEPGKFGQLLTGTYTGSGRYEDQSALPDFYAAFAVGRGKPMAVTETSAFYSESPPVPGDDEARVKTAWLEQVYGAATRDRFPLVKLVAWFDVRKYESEAGGVVDWRASSDPAVLAVLQRLATPDRYVFAPPPAPPGVPTALAGSGAGQRVALRWEPPVPARSATVTGYRACALLAAGPRCQDLEADARTATFDGMPRRTLTAFTVRALGDGGHGEAATVGVRPRLRAPVAATSSPLRLLRAR